MVKVLDCVCERETARACSSHGREKRDMLNGEGLPSTQH